MANEKVFVSYRHDVLELQLQMGILEDFERRRVEPRFDRRVRYLSKCTEIDPRHIKACVRQCEEKLSSGVKAMVVYGEPQSGKTEFMIALSCKLMDMGYETIVVLVNDNIELEKQNYKRFKRCAQLDGNPILSPDKGTASDDDIAKGKKRVIFCRKNAKMLDGLEHLTRLMEKLVVMDDEADYATPDNNVNEEESSTINRLVSRLVERKKGVYIGVTATPGRLDLNDTFNVQPENWTFLDPPEPYSGREMFFPSTVGEDKTKFHLVQIKESQNMSGCRKEALMRFLIRAAFLNKDNINDECGKVKGWTMLMHTSGQIADHRKERHAVAKFFSKFDPNSPRDVREKHFAELKEMVPEALPGERVDPQQLTQIIYDHIEDRQICLVNSSKDRDGVEEASNPESMFTVAIGGNMISRGITFNNLLTYFFTRGVQGKMMQNTYIQRARMFGMREKYVKHIEIAVPEELYARWALCFSEHEMSIEILRNSKEYLHVHSDGTRPAPGRSIKKAKVEFLQGEIDAGNIFSLTREVEEIIRDTSLSALKRIEILLSQELIGGQGFRRGIYEYLKKVSRGDSSKIGMVLMAEDQIHNIEGYKDHVGETIKRSSRRDLISATINRREKQFGNFNHLIMPTRYRDRARFVYVGKENKRIILRKEEAA